MNEDVTLELAGEEQRDRARVAAANGAGVHCSLKIFGQNAKAAARRRLFGFRVERHDDGGLSRGHVHLHRDRRPDDGGGERHEPLGETAEHDSRIGGSVGCDDLVQELRNGDAALAHRRGEELLFGRKVAQDRRGRDVHRRSDVSESRRRKAALGECGMSGFENLLSGDARWSSHL